MFRFSLHKMGKNRWLTLSLLAGYLMAVAIVCSMPIYSHAILGRMLTKDLEQIQLERNIYPGRVNISANLMSSDSSGGEKFRTYDRRIQEELIPDIGLPIVNQSAYTAITSQRFVHREITDPEEIEEHASRGEFAACTGVFDHLTLLEGTFPSAEIQDGIIEAVVTENASRELNLALGSVYSVYNYELNLRENSAEYFHVADIRITGIAQLTDTGDAFWVMPRSVINSCVLIHPDLFQKLYIDGGADILLDRAEWALALDYRDMTPENCGSILQTFTKYDNSQFFPPTFRTVSGKILEQYDLRREQLNAMLWIIEIPILLMLLFYIMMVSRLILEHEKNEIAVLRSRGGSKIQVIAIYFWQSLILAVIAFLLGPLFGLLFCRMIGASSGFMEFVSRKALPVALTGPAVLYAAVTGAVLVLTMLTAVICGKETSIVSFKRKKSGRSTMPLWQKLGLDLICLAVSGYGLYNFQNRLKLIRETGISASDTPIDFMMYISSTLFILGMTLLFLRIFPLLIRLIYRIGQKFWSPVLYLSLLNISRGSGKNQMISLFLSFTLSMGIFNAVTVRTLNQNNFDRICYTIGADIVLQEKWPSTESGRIDLETGAPIASDEPIYYTEPQFSKYEQMETAEAAARVLKVNKCQLSAGSVRANSVSLMGIVPNEFGKVCWMRRSLLPHHINEYLNLMADNPRALLLSDSFMKENSLEPGDTIFLSIGKNANLVQFTAYAGVDYFPSFQPLGESGKPAVLAVANLIYLQQETKLEPYQVWLKKAPGVTSAELYQELSDMDMEMISLQDTTAELTRLKNDPMTQGVNGFFTLSFLVTMLITIVGFFIYWILAIRSRLLQFGLLRSMGLGRMSVVMVLLWEQLLVSVTAILAGLGTGTLTAMLFAPVLECNVDAADQILPFMVAAAPGDYWRIIILVALMMLAAAAVLGQIVFRLHAGEALKLGED